MTVTYNPIITSLLDNDLYKFTMLQAMLHQFPQTHGVYRFRCRNNNDAAYPLATIKDSLEQQLDSLCQLRFLPDELEYLRTLRFMRSDFVDYLELFQLKRRFIKVSADSKGRLLIDIEGPMIQAMFFEVFVLAIVNELYFNALSNPEVIVEGQRRLQDKVALLHRYAEQQDSNNSDKPPFIVADFGTRRRFSKSWQAHVVKTLHQAQPNIVSGTSNVLLAKTLEMTPIGTMAHEFMQAFQALDVRLRDSQKAALEAWVHEYRGDLGIALTDVVGMCVLTRF